VVPSREMFAAVVLLCPAFAQDSIEVQDPAPSAAQVAFYGREWHGYVPLAAGADVDPSQWVRVARDSGLSGLVVEVRGDEAWLPVLVDAAREAGVPLGWALEGDPVVLERLLEFGAPFLVSIRGEDPGASVDLLRERAPTAVIEGGPHPDVGPPALAAAAEGWVVPLARAAVPAEPADLEGLYLETVGRGQNLALELVLDDEGRVTEGARRALIGFAEWRARTFGEDHARTGRVHASHGMEGSPATNAVDGDPRTWWMTEPERRVCFLDLQLARVQVVDTVVLAEPMEFGSRILGYQLQARRNNTWTDVHRGEGIGVRRMLRIPPEAYQGFRLIITEASAAPAIATFGLFTAPPTVEVHVGETVFMGTTRLRFSTSSPEAQVRYTLDGSLPTESSELYTRPVTIDRSCRVTALASSPGNPGLVPASIDLRAYTLETLPAPAEPPTLAGLRARLWCGTWAQLEDVDWGAAPDEEHVLPTLEHLVTAATPHALLFEGLVHAPRAGIYGLFARGGAAVRVFVAGELAVESSGDEEVLGELGLQAGWHPLRIEVLRGKDAAFRVQWRGPSLSKRSFAAKELGR
jgi:hypothetical protein